MISFQLCGRWFALRTGGVLKSRLEPRLVVVAWIILFLFLFFCFFGFFALHIIDAAQWLGVQAAPCGCLQDWAAAACVCAEPLFGGAGSRRGTPAVPAATW